MKINQMAEFFQLCFNSKVTPALVGTSGVGKTSICKQAAKELGFNRTIILRPSLVADVGDLVGLPDFTVIDGESRTTFKSPDWLPKKDEKCLIVVDEINRTQKDIIMAMFDLIEAEKPKIGNYILPEGCKVVATLNPPTENYEVLDLKDSAFVSRLCFVKVIPDFDSFESWGKSTDEVTPEMLSFLKSNPNFFGIGEQFEVDDFFGVDANEQGNHFKNNNRSKKKVSDLFKNSQDLKTSESVLFEAIRGISGLEVATAFIKFTKQIKAINLDYILGKKENLENFDYSNMSNIWKIIEEIKTRMVEKEFPETKREKIFTFLMNCPLDTVYGFLEYVSSYNEKVEKDSSEEKLINIFMNQMVDHKEFGDFITKIGQTKSSEEK